MNLHIQRSNTRIPYQNSFRNMNKCVTSGKYTGSYYTIEIKENDKPYHTNPIPIPKAYKPTLKNYVKRLIKIGVLKKSTVSLWTAPIYIIPKKNGTVRFISDFRELNSTKKEIFFHYINIQDFLLKPENLRCATSLDPTMGYFNVLLCPLS